MSHKSVTTGDIHIIYNAEYATRESREAATYTSGDIGRIVKQTDENSYWVVVSTNPTFAKISTDYGEQNDITGNTETTIWSFTLPTNSSLTVSAKVHAMQDTGDERNYYWYEGLFYRTDGSATQQGSTISLITPIESDATPSVSFSVSGNDVLLRWTGVAAETWNVIPIVKFNLNK